MIFEIRAFGASSKQNFLCDEHVNTTKALTKSKNKVLLRVLTLNQSESYFSISSYQLLFHSLSR